MLALRSLIRSSAPLTKNVIQQRNMSLLGIPPRNKVSKGEVIALATIMVIGWCAIPSYVLVNMKNYRHKD